MENKEGILLAMADDEAWSQVSKDFQWTETLLERYQDRVDWEEVSDNRETAWTIPMLQKFSKRINWTKFSSMAGKELLTDQFLETFKDQWDWKALSENTDLELTDEVLTRYGELLDWEEIIERRAYANCPFEGHGIDFYQKYREHLPASVSSLRDTSLWDEIVEQRKNQIIDAIVGR